MKKILLLYFWGFIASILLGGVAAVSYHYSWWFLILLCIPSFGLFVLRDVFRKINDENLPKVTILTIVSFVIMLLLLSVAGYYNVNEWSFWGMVYAGGIVSYILGLILIAFGLTKRWEYKREREGKFWIKKSASYWCRFFLENIY